MTVLESKWVDLKKIKYTENLLPEIKLHADIYLLCKFHIKF